MWPLPFFLLAPHPQHTHTLTSHLRTTSLIPLFFFLIGCCARYPLTVFFFVSFPGLRRKVLKQKKKKHAPNINKIKEVVIFRSLLLVSFLCLCLHTLRPFIASSPFPKRVKGKGRSATIKSYGLKATEAKKDNTILDTLF